MRNAITKVLLVGALAVVPAIGFAATPGVATTRATAHHEASTRAAIHATRGVVKSMNANTLVISRSGKKGGEMTFSLNSSTQRQGNVAVGSPVSVRYQKQGKTDVATAITAQPAKEKKQAAATSGVKAKKQASAVHTRASVK